MTTMSARRSASNVQECPEKECRQKNAQSIVRGKEKRLVRGFVAHRINQCQQSQSDTTIGMVCGCVFSAPFNVFEDETAQCETAGPNELFSAVLRRVPGTVVLRSRSSSRGASSTSVVIMSRVPGTVTWPFFIGRWRE